jgi:hypothetical protein
MKKIWFKKTGFLYMPVHVIGVLITLMTAAITVFFFVAIDRQSHSVSDTLIDFFVYFTCTAFWWKWIAEKTSN